MGRRKESRGASWFLAYTNECAEQQLGEGWRTEPESSVSQQHLKAKRSSLGTTAQVRPLARRYNLSSSSFYIDKAPRGEITSGNRQMGREESPHSGTLGRHAQVKKLRSCQQVRNLGVVLKKQLSTSKGEQRKGKSSSIPCGGSEIPFTAKRKFP